MVGLAKARPNYLLSGDVTQQIGFAVSVSIPSVRTMQQNPLMCLLTFIKYKLLCTSDAFSDTTFK